MPAKTEVTFMIKNYKDLLVWQKAMDLTVEVYRLVKFLPREETYALSDKCAALSFQFRQTLPKDTEETQRKNTLNFCSLHAVLKPNWKLNCKFA